jgi:hypothetical protein
VAAGNEQSGLVQAYLGVQALLGHIEPGQGACFWSRLADMPMSTLSLLGFRRAADIEYRSRQAHAFQTTIARLDRLANYRTPVEERFASLFAWRSSSQRLLPRSPQIAREYPKEVALLRARPKARVVALAEATPHCPACFHRLAQKEPHAYQLLFGAVADGLAYMHHVLAGPTYIWQ